MKDEKSVEAYGIGHDMPIFISQAWCVFCCRSVDSHDMRSQLTIILQSCLEEGVRAGLEINVFNITKPRKFAA